MRTGRQFGESGATRPTFANLWQVSAVYVRKSVSRAREGDGDGSIHGGLAAAMTLLSLAATGFTGFASFGDAWWFTIRREPR